MVSSRFSLSPSPRNPLLAVLSGQCWAFPARRPTRVLTLPGVGRFSRVRVPRPLPRKQARSTPPTFFSLFFAVYSLDGLLVFGLLFVCTCAYFRKVPRLKTWLLSEKRGVWGVFYKGRTLARSAKDRHGKASGENFRQAGVRPVGVALSSSRSQADCIFSRKDNLRVSKLFFLP